MFPYAFQLAHAVSHDNHLVVSHSDEDNFNKSDICCDVCDAIQNIHYVSPETDLVTFTTQEYCTTYNATYPDHKSTSKWSFKLLRAPPVLV